jgi:hypothetical protein
MQALRGPRSSTCEGALSFQLSPAQDDCPVFSEGENKRTVLQAAAMGTKWWEPARDALDTMVLNAAALHELEGYQHTDFMPFDPTIKVCAHSLPRRFYITIIPMVLHPVTF